MKRLLIVGLCLLLIGCAPEKNYVQEDRLSLENYTKDLWQGDGNFTIRIDKPEYQHKDAELTFTVSNYSNLEVIFEIIYVNPQESQVHVYCDNIRDFNITQFLYNNSFEDYYKYSSSVNNLLLELLCQYTNETFINYTLTYAKKPEYRNWTYLGEEE